MRRFGLFLSVGAGLFLALGVAGGQQPQGRGGFGGGGAFGGRFGGAAQADPLSLLRNPQVKKELELTDEQMEQVPDAVMKALAGVLNDKQVKRLRQISLQQRGSSAFKDAKVQKELNITDDQAKNIDTVLDDARKEMAEAFKGAGGDFGGMREKLQNLRTETDEKVLGVLSSEQRKAWKQLVGEEFKLEQPTFGGAGGFGGKGFQRKKKTDE